MNIVFGGNIEMYAIGRANFSPIDLSLAVNGRLRHSVSNAMDLNLPTFCMNLFKKFKQFTIMKKLMLAVVMLLSFTAVTHAASLKINAPVKAEMSKQQPGKKHHKKKHHHKKHHKKHDDGDMKK